jgi:oligopeptidase B
MKPTFKQTPPPAVMIRPHETTHHGMVLRDDYAWLRAENWQEMMRNPASLDLLIRTHLEAENAYQKKVMEETGPLQKTLVAEMRGRIKEDDSSVPMRDGPWAYGVRYVEGGEQPVFIREPATGGATQVLLDGDKEAQGHDYFRLGGAEHSPQHDLLAWAYDDKGSEYYKVHFRDLASGEDRAESIENTAGGGSFNIDGRYFFYTSLDDNHRPNKLFLHTMGDTGGTDHLLYEEPDSGLFLSAGTTQSRQWIVIDTHDHETSQAWLVPSADPLARPVLVAPRQTGVEYSIDEGGGTLYILTNRDGAKDFKIVAAPVETPQPEHWRDLVPHQPGRLILSHSVYKRHLVWLERENGLPRIMVRRLSDGDTHAIAFEEEAYSLGLGGAYEFDTDVIRFTYSSMTTPSETFDYNMETRERTLLKVQEVPSGHDPANYVTRRVFARATDGELVPVSLLYHKDTPLDGSAPCLLYGYGSYGISVPAAFNTNCLSLVNRGFVYAIAHVRGGKDKGFAWYEAGKRERKTNTFSDFIAVARHLAAEKYSSAGKIVAQGGSAGGSLVGAALNMAPELFAGVVAEVPFVDVLNTMLDDTLPLTPPEWPEWGNPLGSKQDFETIASWCPYENIKPQAYPPVLATAGLTDPRVTYWEAAKWVAKLRANNTGSNPVMLAVNMGAGHAGQSGRYKSLEKIALVYAFAILAAGASIEPLA